MLHFVRKPFQSFQTEPLKGRNCLTVSADAGNPLFGGDSEIDTIFKAAEQTMVLGVQLGSYKLISCTDDYI
jgi:hypothetical protein